MRDSQATQMSFPDFGDEAVMDAIEWLYSCSDVHLRNCPFPHLYDVLCFLNYILASDLVSKLFEVITTRMTGGYTPISRTDSRDISSALSIQKSVSDFTGIGIALL